MLGKTPAHEASTPWTTLGGDPIQILSHKWPAIVPTDFARLRVKLADRGTQSSLTLFATAPQGSPWCASLLLGRATIQRHHLAQAYTRCQVCGPTHFS